jgi:hypothetical protein
VSWQFNEMVPGDLNVDPMEKEFFLTEALGSVTDALVREAIQNSLDAARDAHERVIVRFLLGQADESAKQRYLGDLWPHAQASIDGTAELPPHTAPLTFLAVEDHGTIGLRGEPAQYEDDDDEGPRNDFYYFWRNVGRSKKETTERGRWGLGKTVFAAASRIHSFFGLTVRHGDPRPLLMGQSVLSIHKVAGQRYQPYGYYGVHESRLTLPMQASADTAAFARCFGLDRQTDAGLSVVIPYPDDEITAASLVRSVLKHYFHPLIEGRLQVMVENGGSVVALRQQDLEQRIRQEKGLDLRNLLPLVQLATWGLDPEDPAAAKLTPPHPGRAPRLTSDLFLEGDLSRLRRRYEQGHRIALRIPLYVQRPGQEARPAVFRLLMERDDSVERGEGYFVRQGITIENSSARRPRGVRWIAVIEDPALSSFLGDAENPAHTEWQRSSAKFKDKYALGPSTIDFVRSAPHNIAAILSRPAEGRDPELLRHIFALGADVPLSARHRETPSADGEDQATPPKPMVGEMRSGGELVLSSVKSGFQLKGQAGVGAPKRFRVLAAYEVLRGDAFRHHSPLDFRMDNDEIAVAAQGARVVTRGDNWLEIEALEPSFDVRATGFDEKRDLRVKVEPIREAV